MKKKLLALSLIVICLATAVGGSLAYYSAKGTAHNIITSGNVTIEVVEKQEKDGVLVEYPSQPITNVMPGASVSKIVSVKNTGSGDAWIRVQITKTITLADGTTAGSPNLLEIAFNSTEWTEKDGWFYYKKPVAPDAETTALMESVKFSKNMGDEYQLCTANILVNAQAVQVKNNGETYADAAGWPDANTVMRDEEKQPELPEPNLNPGVKPNLPGTETEDQNGNPDETVETEGNGNHDEVIETDKTNPVENS